MIYCFHVLDLQPEPKTPQKKQNEFYTNEGIIITLKTGSITTETVSNDCNGAREVSVHNRLGSGRAHTSSRSNFLHFHAVCRKIWPNNRLTPPFRVGVPPGNSGYATDGGWLQFERFNVNHLRIFTIFT